MTEIKHFIINGKINTRFALRFVHGIITVRCAYRFSFHGIFNEIRNVCYCCCCRRRRRVGVAASRVRDTDEIFNRDPLSSPRRFGMTNDRSETDGPGLKAIERNSICSTNA